MIFKQCLKISKKFIQICISLYQFSLFVRKICRELVPKPQRKLFGRVLINFKIISSGNELSGFITDNLYLFEAKFFSNSYECGED